jgi:hypothetical protein
VEVEHEGGEITFQRGRLVDATLREHRGLNALLPILLLADGAYTVTFTGMVEEGSFSLTLEELCRNILPSIWQWRRHAESGVHLSSRLVADFVRLRDLLPEFPAAVSEVIRLFDGHRTVRAIVMDSPLDEVTTFAVISRLHKMRVLVPWTAAAKPEMNRGLAIAKKLFKQHKASADSPSPASKPGQVDSGKHYEDLGLLLLEEQGPASGHHSRAQKAFNTAAAVIGAVVVAVGASWVVARGNPGSSLFSWARGPAAAKGQPAPQAAVAQAGTVASDRWFDVERNLGASRITPTARAQSAPEFWLIMALARFQSGDREGAKAAAHHALELDPRNGGAAVLLGTLHLDAEENAEAERELQRYLELEPHGAYAEQARQLLKPP